MFLNLHGIAKCKRHVRAIANDDLELASLSYWARYLPPRLYYYNGHRRAMHTSQGINELSDDYINVHVVFTILNDSVIILALSIYLTLLPVKYIETLDIIADKHHFKFLLYAYILLI